MFTAKAITDNHPKSFAKPVKTISANSIYIHLNSRELKARHVNRRSMTQCNATSRFRYTVLFGINVQVTIKYLPFDMSGTVAESVTDTTLLLQRQGRNFANISQKSVLYGVTVKCRDCFQHS